MRNGPLCSRHVSTAQGSEKRETDQRLLALWAITAAFTAYFCMYAFRKPFQAVAYEGYSGQFLLTLKTVFVLSRLFGYTISKYVGVKVCSEITKKYRLPVLIGLILTAELALVLFGLLPVKLKWIAIFLNGLPLGMVWGMCVLYLEGRKITEFLLAGLACSYIIASGIVKDAGRFLLSHLQLEVFWMPAVTGLVFLPAFLLFAWLLSHMPPPTKEDEDKRTYRRPMTGRERWAFLRFFWVGIVLQLSLYFFITAFRDVRDAYSAEIWKGLGLSEVPAIFSRSEMVVGFVALTALVIIRFFDSRKWGVIPNLACQILGFLVLGGGTLAFGYHAISGFQWMVLIGIGGYLAYVPCDTIFYERVIARASWVSTALFMTYVMDAGGYTGSVVLQLFMNYHAPKALTEGGSAPKDYTFYVKFFEYYGYFLAAIGLIVIAFNIFYFPYRARVRRRMIAQGRAPAVPSQAS